MAGLCFAIQKASSRLTCTMIELTVIFLLFLPALTLCVPVTAGGNGPVHTFYCKLKGCAADVTKVFCEEKSLLHHSDIPNCSGPPQPNNVCQHDGRAFVSISTNGDCQFEGQDYIETEKCTDLNNICLFNDPTSSPPVSPKGLQESNDKQTKHIVIVTGVVVGLALLLVVVLGLIAYVCKKRWTRQQNHQQQSDTGENEALKMEQISADIERAPPADPGLDDDTSPSQCDSIV